MKRKSSLPVMLCSLLLFIISCQKQIDKPFVPSEQSVSANVSNAQKQKKKIYVAKVDELYAVVNDPSNEGADVTLAPGVYALSSNYPNGGRLELQIDMSLRGQPGQPDAVLIDESALPIGSFRLTATTSTGGIRVGRGNNSLSWLSIKGGSLAANPFSVIETDLGTIETTVNITHVNIDCNGSRIGIMLRNRNDEHAGRTIDANLEHSEIANAVNTIGFGLALQNRISGASIKLEMKENYIHGCKIGILNFNNGASNTVEHCAAQITSHADRIEANGCGMDLSGGSSGTTISNNNSVSLKMYGSTIKDNNPAGNPELLPTNGALPSGIYAAGAYNGLNNISAYNRASNNLLSLEFWGCDISNNNGTDIYLYGAWSAPLALLAGSNNLAEIYLHGFSANATTETAASVPVEPAGTNLAHVFRD